jgi:hypothetical protein
MAEDRNSDQNRRPLLGNNSMNKFPEQGTRDATMEELLEALFYLLSVLRLYYSESYSDKIFGRYPQGTWCKTD